MNKRTKSKRKKKKEEKLLHPLHNDVDCQGCRCMKILAINKAFNKVTRNLLYLYSSKDVLFRISSSIQDLFIKTQTLPIRRKSSITQLYLTTMRTVGEKKARSSYFKFENMCLEADSFMEMVKQWWILTCSMGDLILYLLINQHL